MSFELLDETIRNAIVNQLQWRSLRPIQERAIPPIKAGRSALLVAPTAGGKTEAALFPLLTRVIEEGWGVGSILWISPLRALANNLIARLQPTLMPLGREVVAWTGDTPERIRRQVRLEPPDVLVTTPESIEGMLLSKKTDATRMFANVRAVVVDEVHAFGGDDRGWHLLAVLARLEQLAGRSFQRIGLSATVGNPEEVLEWLTSTPATASDVVEVSFDDGLEPEVKIDWVATLENAATVISRLYTSERRLVFCDSRIVAERLTAMLRAMNVPTWIVHGSLSRDEREQAEKSFIEGLPGVVVATSALELGIDVGSLDRVIQIDAPWTVSSFLQRMGRTGRREGKRPNTLFLCTSRSGLVRAAAIVSCWERGSVERVTPPPAPYHIFAQQMLALVLERPGMSARQFHQAVADFQHIARIEEPVRALLMKWMLDNHWLFTDGVRVSIGAVGERKFGAKNFLKLMSVFTSPPVVTLYNQRKEIGTVHAVNLLDHTEANPATVILAGRVWRVDAVDWSRHRAWVVPTGSSDGTTWWFGGAAEVGAELAVGHRRVLSGKASRTHWSKRTTEKLEDVLVGYDFLPAEGTALVRRATSVEFWTFAGGLRNRTIAAGLRALTAADGVRHDGLCVHLETDDLQGVQSALDSLAKCGGAPVPADPSWLKDLKFGEVLPEELIQKLATARGQDPTFVRILHQPRTVIELSQE